MTSRWIGIGLVAFSVVVPSRSLRTAIDSATVQTQGADTVKVLLAEVLFAPAVGDTAFVELANVGTRPVDLSSMVLRIDTLVFPLPRLAEPFAPGARVVVRFDGQGRIEGNVVHASEGVVLSADGGVVSLLRNDNFVLDRLAWGTAEGAFRPRMGGLVAPSVDPGSSYGRPPGANQPGAATDWVMYPAGQVTPGRANPMPPVIQLLPLDGAILEASSADLSWYAVPGTVRYRVQFASDTTFTQPLLDQIVEEPAINSGQRPAGIYWWRVQAIGPDGPAAWSRRQQIELSSRTGGDSDDGGEFEEEPLGERDGPAPGITSARTLNVPYLKQHKDTRMLMLESWQEALPRTAAKLPRVPHAWDGDHGTLDLQDQADNMNCGLASMAMMNRFHGGDLSQDRLGYEVFSRNVTRYAARVASYSFPYPYARAPLVEHTPGPAYDLNYGMGISPMQMLAMGLFALGALPGPGSGYVGTDGIWRLAVAEIDAGRPLIAWNCCHLVVIRGYELRGTRRLLYVNDPWSGRYAFDLDAAPAPVGQLLAVYSYPTHPAVARQEAAVTTDTDGDGVYDFDEIHRFRTSPNNPDSDADGVKDKRDIASGTYENEHWLGYAWTKLADGPGRDYDGDGIPTELDRDSDNGGCIDGDEDVNKDGIRTGDEFSNFDPTDDMCGNLEGNVSYLIDAINTNPDDIAKHIHDQAVILVRLKPESPGSSHYVDNGSTFSYQGFARSEINLPHCVIWGREQSSGSGPFTGAQIGATRGDDSTLAFDALVDVPSNTATGGCSATETRRDQRSVNFPLCEGRLAPNRTGTPPLPTYVFDCTTKPDMPPGWTVTRFYVRGFIRVVH